MTSPNRPSNATSTGDMLAKTRRRAEQLRRRRRGVVTGVAAAVIVVAIAVPLLARSPHRSRVVGVTGEPTTVTSAIPAPSIPVPPTTATTVVPAATSTTQPSIPQCATSQLRATLTNPSGAAGSVGYDLKFVNTGAVSCSLTGYPGVSYRTGTAQTLVGAPAQRDPLSAPVTVTVRPGQAAYATLMEVDSLNYPPATCQLTSVSGLWIYPPDQRAALFLPQSAQVCSNPADPVLMVGPMRAS